MYLIIVVSLQILFIEAGLKTLAFDRKKSSVGDCIVMVSFPRMEGVDYLASERNKAQFDVEEMKVVWAGSRHALEVSDRISRLVASDPVSFPDFVIFLPEFDSRL